MAEAASIRFRQEVRVSDDLIFVSIGFVFGWAVALCREKP